MDRMGARRRGPDWSVVAVEGCLKMAGYLAVDSGWEARTEPVYCCTNRCMILGMYQSHMF